MIGVDMDSVLVGVFLCRKWVVSFHSNDLQDQVRRRRAGHGRRRRRWRLRKGWARRRWEGWGERRLVGRRLWRSGRQGRNHWFACWPQGWRAMGRSRRRRRARRWRSRQRCLGRRSRWRRRSRRVTRRWGWSGHHRIRVELDVVECSDLGVLAAAQVPFSLWKCVGGMQVLVEEARKLRRNWAHRALWVGGLFPVALVVP